MEQPFLFLFAFLITSKLLWQLYLNIINGRYVIQHQGSVPPLFAGQVPLTEHQKAANYTVAKLHSSRWWMLFDFIILWFWLLLGLRFIHQEILSFQFSPLVTDLFFISFFTLINLIIALPHSLHNTFVIEQKFGYNRMSLKLFFVDLIKELLLLALLGIPLMAFLFWIVYQLGDFWWIYSWAVITLFQVFMMWLFPTLIAPLFNRFTPLPEGEVKERVENLLKRLAFPCKGLFVMDASRRSGHGNAYFTGIGKQKRIVLFDTLLQGLTPSEVEAVLAHELGHFRCKHIQKGLFKAIVMSFVAFALLGYLYHAPWFYSAFSLTPGAASAFILFSLLSEAFTFWLTPLFTLSSRRHEFEADRFSAKFSSAKELISALIKMYKDNGSTLTPHPLYSRFYYSHPPASERVQVLQSLDS